MMFLYAWNLVEVIRKTIVVTFLTVPKGTKKRRLMYKSKKSANFGILWYSFNAVNYFLKNSRFSYSAKLS